MKKKKLKIVRALLQNLEGTVAEELEKLQEYNGLNEILEIIPGGMVTIGGQAIAVTYIKYEQDTVKAKDAERFEQEKKRKEAIKNGEIPPWAFVVELWAGLYDELLSSLSPKDFEIFGPRRKLSKMFPIKMEYQKILLTKEGLKENCGIMATLYGNDAWDRSVNVDRSEHTRARFGWGEYIEWQKKEN